MARRTVGIGQIALRDDWQVRKRLDQQALNRYTAQYRGESGRATLPPIEVADIDGVLFVVDGWHRLEAAKRADLDCLDVTVVTSDASQAAWCAATANMKHGVPLKRAELRSVFRAYVRAGKHRRGTGLRSYRQIAQDLHDTVRHTTVRNWMTKDFPNIARRYRPEEAHGNEAAGPPTPHGNPTTPFEIALDYLDNLMAIRSGLSEVQKALLDEIVGERLQTDPRDENEYIDF